MFGRTYQYQKPFDEISIFGDTTIPAAKTTYSLSGGVDIGSFFLGASVWNDVVGVSKTRTDYNLNSFVSQMFLGWRIK